MHGAMQCGYKGYNVSKYCSVFRHYNSSLDNKYSRLPANQYADTVMIPVARKVYSLTKFVYMQLAMHVVY